MPIYEYRCEDCGTKFEQLTSIDAPLPECASCGSAKTRKLVSASGFILKGGGWYKDHYGLKSSGSSTSSETSVSSSDSSSSDS